MPRFETALPPFFRDRTSERPIQPGRGPSPRNQGWRQDAKTAGKRPRSSEKILGEAAEAREIRPPRGRERSDMALIAAI